MLYILLMQVPNPLVPPPVGSPGGAPAAVANAPNVVDSTRHETSRPVTAGKSSDRARSDGERPRSAPSGDGQQRGTRLDITV
jgi:hypothetical protein